MPDLGRGLAPVRARRARWIAGRAGRVVALAFLTYHAAAVLLTLVPESPLRTRLQPWFDDYYKATGTTQSWEMFHTVPFSLSSHAEIEAVDSTGKVHLFGPILPGLLPYDESYWRYHSVLSRMMTTHDRYLEPYVENVKNEIERLHGLDIRSITVRLRYQRIRYLKDIREHGEIAFDDVTERGPYTWPD